MNVTISGTDYDGWVGKILGVVHESSAHGTVLDVLISPDDETEPVEVYLPASVVRSFQSRPRMSKFQAFLDELTS